MINRNKVLAALAMAITAVFTALPAANATHDGQPTTQELMYRCVSADYCQFKPNGAMQIFSGPRQLAGSGTNCTSSLMTRVINYSATTGTKNTFGVEISGGVQLGKIFEASIKASYTREWSFSETKTDEVRQEIKPRKKVNIFASKQKSRVNGTWEIHFGKRYYGHYYWYVNGSVDGQTKDQAWDIRAEEVNAVC
ncbi:hypothetical protein PV646_33625 [Streptomyces sp. ID05-26A]|nr:hypothetical protein [Streptomyces sp. ID05-26A]